MYSSFTSTTVPSTLGRRALRHALRVSASIGLCLSMSCAKSAVVPPLPSDDAGADVRTDSGLTCSMPMGTTYACGPSVSTPWFVTTTNSSLTGTLPLTSAMGEGFSDCPRTFSATWDATPFGRSDLARLVLLVRDPTLGRYAAPVSSNGTTTVGECVLEFQRADGTDLASVPCRFDGCFAQDPATDQYGLSGRLRASGSGFDVDTTFAVPVCSVIVCI